MKRVLLAPAILAAVLAVIPAAPASARTYLGFTIGVGSAPPPPRVYFRERPHLALVPSTRVYVVNSDDNDMDMFRYGRFYYVMRGGYWYRGPSYHGPFMVIDVRSVPQEILYVPASNWRHHPHGGPPGRWRHGRGHGRY